MAQAQTERGADEALTQFFFEAESFFRFRDACASGRYRSHHSRHFADRELERCAPLCRSLWHNHPSVVDEAFEKAYSAMIVATYWRRHFAVNSALNYLDGGVKKLHFYTLNRRN